MYINFFILPFIIILGLSLSNSDKDRKVFIIIVTLILSLESSLRSLFLVADTFSYYEMFTQRVPDMTWGDIWSGFKERYFGQGDDDFDFGFYVLQKTIGYVTSSYQIFTFLSQLLLYIPMGIFLYKYSTNMKQLIFAFVFYVALIHTGALGGGRQVLARGCWIMSFMMIVDKKYIKGALWLLLGITFHYSLFIVLAAVALGFLNGKRLKWVHLISLFLIPLAILFPREIISYMGNSIGSERYASYGSHEITGGAVTFVSLMILLSLFCFIMYSRDSLNNNKIKRLYAMLPCLTFVAPLIVADGVMIRLSNYFHMFLMLIVPFAIEEFKDRKTVIAVYTLMIGALLFLALKDGGLEYYFFWQDVGFGFH